MATVPYIGEDRRKPVNQDLREKLNGKSGVATHFAHMPLFVIRFKNGQMLPFLSDTVVVPALSNKGIAKGLLVPGYGESVITNFAFLSENRVACLASGTDMFLVAADSQNKTANNCFVKEEITVIRLEESTMNISFRSGNLVEQYGSVPFFHKALIAKVSKKINSTGIRLGYSVPGFSSNAVSEIKLIDQTVALVRTSPKSSATYLVVQGDPFIGSA